MAYVSGADSAEEMRNMAGENGKKRGCCRRHPVACGVTLLVVGFVSLAVVGAAIGLRPFLNKTFMDTVDKVMIRTSHVLHVVSCDETSDSAASRVPCSITNNMLFC